MSIEFPGPILNSTPLKMNMYWIGAEPLVLLQLYSVFENDCQMSEAKAIGIKTIISLVISLPF